MSPTTINHLLQLPDDTLRLVLYKIPHSQYKKTTKVCRRFWKILQEPRLSIPRLMRIYWEAQASFTMNVQTAIYKDFNRINPTLTRYQELSKKVNDFFREAVEPRLKTAKFEESFSEYAYFVPQIQEAISYCRVLNSEINKIINPSKSTSLCRVM